MIENNYKTDFLELSFKSNSGQVIDFEHWVDEINDPTLPNILNDLIVNGTALLNNKKTVTIFYENISVLDKYERDVLELPEQYPYDIFIDISGFGLKDTNLKLKYSFQDFAHKNGSGNILFSNNERTGAYLKNKLEFILSSKQFDLVQKIEGFNNLVFSDSNSVLKELSKIQKAAIESNAVLSQILVDTLIVAPEQIKIDLVEVDNGKYRLKPIIQDIDNDKLQKSFDIFPRVKSEYNFKDSNKKVRVVIDDKANQSSNSIKSELQKLKNKGELSQDDVNEIYNSPTKFWDSDIIDIEEFGKRVLELGLYKPRFYPFISPYKSEWIPGIAIDDKKEGTRYLSIKNQKELDQIKELKDESIKDGKNSILFKGENIDLKSIESIIENAQSQINNPQKPITNSKLENEKNETQNKVLIIKENAEENEYTEFRRNDSEVTFSFQQITNLSNSIQLKEHQKEGISWLQTLSSPPYSFPGVLLADDMGLGKTLQVLYFIEWFSQKRDNKPILVVAPVSLLENWQNEYHKFFPSPNLEIVTLWGANVKYHIIANDKKQTIHNLNKSAIYLTTYETLRKQQIPLGLIDWGLVILDEAQKIKTPGTFVTNAAKALKSEFKIAMTGTPVENSLMDLWCIIDFCSPGLLENAKRFAKQYQKPLKDSSNDINGLSSELRNNIGQALLRRMKFNVAKDLPKIEYLKNEENMPKEQFDSYMNELSLIEDLKKNKNSILQGIFNLRSISDHPYLKHYQIENIESSKLINSSAKLKKVISILEEVKAKKEKAIIFTDNKSMQRVLRKIIQETFLISPVIINGETPTSKSNHDLSKLSRQQEIDKFQNVKGFNVIIMSPIAAGFGLNITEANHVIHYTRHWNPAKEQQATDRAYRIGQKKPVKVYYPLAVSPNNDFKSFDIILDELLQRKAQLATNTLFPTEQIEIKKEDFINSITSVQKEKPIMLKHIEDLDKLNPLSFEAAIAILIEKKFGGNSYLTRISNDKGADIIFFGDVDNSIIQIKQSRSKLGISSGQEIFYAVNEYKTRYKKDFQPKVITNNYFTQNAIEMAKQNDIELIDRDIIKIWIKENQLDINEIDKKTDDRL